MKNIIILILLLFPLSVQATPPDDETSRILNEFKDRHDFNNWPAAEPMLIPRVDLSRESIQGTDESTYYDATAKRLIEIYTDKSEQEYCSRYIFGWKNSADNVLNISLYINTSSENAREYLIYLLLFSQVPVYRDSIAVAGEVSFFNGAYFIRNNIIVAIGALGTYHKAIPDIAQEVDAILLRQKSYGSLTDVLPRFSNIEFTKLYNRRAKITPYAFDPLGGSVLIEERLGGGGVYQREGDTIYYHAGEPGFYTILYIAVAESGFYATHTLKITATEDDIFN